MSATAIVRAFTLASNGNLMELKALVGRDVAVDVVRPDGLFKGYTLLHAAASKGHVEVVEYLLSSGASPHVLNAQGKTACTLARDKNQSAVVARLEAAALTTAKSAEVAPTAVAVLADTIAALDISESTLEAQFDEYMERAVAQGRLNEAVADAVTDEIAAKSDSAARCEAMRRIMSEHPEPSAPISKGAAPAPAGAAKGGTKAKGGARAEETTVEGASAVPSATAPSASAQRLLVEQRSALCGVRDALRPLGEHKGDTIWKRGSPYRKGGSAGAWASYVFPTRTMGEHETALENLADARFVLGEAESRGVWTTVLEMLAGACEARRTRAVLPAAEHERVVQFVSEWVRRGGPFVHAAAEHPSFATAVVRFAGAWQEAGAADAEEEEEEEAEEAEDNDGEGDSTAVVRMTMEEFMAAKRAADGTGTAVEQQMAEGAKKPTGGSGTPKAPNMAPKDPPSGGGGGSGGGKGSGQQVPKSKSTAQQHAQQQPQPQPQPQPHHQQQQAEKAKFEEERRRQALERMRQRQQQAIAEQEREQRDGGFAGRAAAAAAADDDDGCPSAPGAAASSRGGRSKGGYGRQTPEEAIRARMEREAREAAACRGSSAVTSADGPLLPAAASQTPIVSGASSEDPFGRFAAKPKGSGGGGGGGGGGRYREMEDTSMSSARERWEREQGGRGGKGGGGNGGGGGGGRSGGGSAHSSGGGGGSGSVGAGSRSGHSSGGHDRSERFSGGDGHGRSERFGSDSHRG